MENAIQRALSAVSQCKKRIGEPLWFALEETLLDRSVREWHPAVFCPIGLAQQALLDYRVPFSDLLELHFTASQVAGLLPWNLTKGVYLFDESLFESLVGAPLERLPPGLIERLPEAAPLILLPKAWNGFVGAWVYLDEDRRETPHLEFRLLLIPERGERLIPLMLDLIQHDFESCVARTQAETTFQGIDGFPPVIFEIIRGFLNLTLYLCSEAPDINGQARKPPPLVSHYRYKRTYPEQKPNRIEVGWRWGAVLRKVREEIEQKRMREGGVGVPVQPHIRRAHWHLYWTGTGSRKDPSKAVPRVRWVEPILVGRRWLQEGEEVPAVIRRIK